MLDPLFQSTTIPVLEQVVGFAHARHQVLAGNIANLDTPGYRVRDLSVEGFESGLRKALEARDRARAVSRAAPAASPGMAGYPAESKDNRALIAHVAKDAKTILYHDDSNVGIEHQVTEMVKNQSRHNLALAILSSQFRLLEAAISEKA
jgi:flagellar basal-body rod protein FlgB